MASGDKYGAYQPYTVAPAWTTAKLADNVSLEDGSTLPLAITTAFVGLFDKLGIPEPTSDGKPATGADKITLLVWGASSSVGAYVIQLAKISGYNIIAVAGAAKDPVRELGVDSSKIVDYRDDRATVIANLNKAAGGSAFTHVYDCITSQDTVETIVELLSTAPNKGGKVTTVLSSAYDDKDTNVKLQKEKGVSFDRTMCGSVHNDKVDFGTRWFKTVTEWTVEGKIKPNKVQLLDGGLDGVPAGLKLLQENKVSNRKLVGKCTASRKARKCDGDPITDIPSDFLTLDAALQQPELPIQRLRLVSIRKASEQPLIPQFSKSSHLHTHPIVNLELGSLSPCHWTISLCQQISHTHVDLTARSQSTKVVA